MPRRKIYKILVKETDFYDLLVDELRLMNPQLATDYDMETLEISMKKKTKPQIQDIDKAIEILKRHLLTYKNEVEVYRDEALVHKNQIAHFLGITRPTLDKWIHEGFIKAIKSKYLPNAYFYPPEEILKQLLHLKDQNGC
jgi:DNA-binding transcriptional regulator YiaG